MDSVELEIRISGLEGRRHRASVERGPSSVGGSRIFELPELAGQPAGAGDWRDLRRQAAPRERSVFSMLNDQGRELFDLVFAGEIYVAFLRSYELAREGGSWFRLQLSFDHAPQAIDLPWEALVFAREGNALALLPRVSIERRLIKAPSIEVPRASADGRIRALVAGACPRGMDKISVEAERKWIKAALGKVVETRLLEHTSLSKLGKELADSAGFDLVHFLGHGDFEGQEGGLWLEDDQGEGVRLSSRELPATLRRPVSFVFLNVCHGGRSSANPFAGLAEALLRSGVRGVVAMRREISDRGAVALAKSFYKYLAQGETLTHALAKARQSVVDTHYGDWAVPMLYLAGEDFALLPRPLPIGVLLGPDLDAGETPEVATDAVPAPPRALFGKSDTGESPWTFKRTVALVLAVLVSAFGMWFVWPAASPSSVEPDSTSGGDVSRDPPPQDQPDEKKKDPPASEAGTAPGKPTGTTTPTGTDAAAKDPVPAPTEAPPKPLPKPAERCLAPAGLEIPMILVRAGVFNRGSYSGGEADERPVHFVRLTENFCLAATELTRGQYAKTMGLTIVAAEAGLPMELTWENAKSFVDMLNKREPGAKFFLPTEAQWEFAARAGLQGDEAEGLAPAANCRSGIQEGAAEPVGRFPPNAWGFYDMKGNVWEWVADWESKYAGAAAIDPRGPAAGDKKIRRGGSYKTDADNCRVTTRQGVRPNRKQEATGLRIARAPVR